MFAFYATDPFLSGEPLLDDDGQEVHSVPWHLQNRFDDFLAAMSDALVEEGVRRQALMHIYLQQALRVLSENPDFLGPGSVAKRKQLADRLLQAAAHSARSVTISRTCRPRLPD